MELPPPLPLSCRAAAGGFGAGSLVAGSGSGVGVGVDVDVGVGVGVGVGDSLGDAEADTEAVASGDALLSVPPSPEPSHPATPSPKTSTAAADAHARPGLRALKAVNMLLTIRSPLTLCCAEHPRMAPPPGREPTPGRTGRAVWGAWGEFVGCAECTTAPARATRGATDHGRPTRPVGPARPTATVGHTSLTRPPASFRDKAATTQRHHRERETPVTWAANRRTFEAGPGRGGGIRGAR